MTDAPPPRLTAGDSWTWEAPAAFAAYPAPDWSLRYSIRPEGGGPIVETAASWLGDVYRVSIPASETAGLPPGAYLWAAVVEHDADGRRETIGRGRLQVLPDPMVETGDTRSDAERILAAIDATLKGRVTRDAESYTIEGRSLSRTPMADLLRLRKVYRAEVRAERGTGAPFSIRRVAF